jgi:hypothetical protein
VKKYRQAVWVLVGAMSVVTSAMAMSESNLNLPSIISPQQVPVIKQDVGRNSDSELRRMESDESIRRNALRLLRPTRAAQQTPIVLAQAAITATPPLDYILKDCRETISMGSKKLAFNVIDPAGSLAEYLGKKSNRDIYSSLAADTIKIDLLEATKHGVITSKVGDVGRMYYVYDAVSNYEGKDKATLMAEFEGKRYKIILELHVFAVAPFENDSVNSCPPPKLIKVNGKPVSGSIDYNLGNITVTLME